MLIDLLISAIVLLIAVVLALLVHNGRLKNRHALALAEAEDKNFTKFWKIGWDSALNDYSAMRNAIRKLEKGPDH